MLYLNTFFPKRTRRLTATVVALGFLWGAIPQFASGQINATVTVDTNAIRSTFSPLGLGLHTSPYYNSLGNPDVDDRLEEAGVTALRFGGGGYADVLHWSIARPQWESGVTGGGLSPWWGEAGNFGYVGPGSDFASFVDLLDRTDNSQAVVTVNYGSALKLVNGQSVVPDHGGQPQEAAAWVAYANADPSIYGTSADVLLGTDAQGNDWKTAGYWARLRASTPNQYQSWAGSDGVYDPLNQFLAIDHDDSVGIQYWEIGNETFGTGYYDGGDGYSVDYDLPYDGTNRQFNPSLSPAKYGEDLVAYAELMRAVDPTIKIGAVLATPPDDFNWSYPDYNNNNQKDANEPYWNDEVLANAADEVDFVVVHWYPWAGNNSNADSLLSQVGVKIPQMINGSTLGLDSGSQAGLRDTLESFGIPDAEIMITEFNYFGSLQSSLEDAAESIYVADAYASWLELGVTSVQYLELLTKDFLTDNGSLEKGSAFYGVSMLDRLAKPGDEFIVANSTEDNVRVHAALQADGSVAVMLLNLDRLNEADVTIEISGTILDDEGIIYTLLGGLSLSEAVETGLGSAFSATVPARSIAVYVIPAVPSLPGDFNNDGSVDAADYTLWRDGLGTIYQSEDYDLWVENYGTSLLSIAESQSVPEPLASVQLVALLATGLLSQLRRRG